MNIIRSAVAMAAMALSGCIGHMSELTAPPADFPKLLISEHKGVFTTLYNCAGPVPLPVYFLVGPPLGCYIINLNRGTCEIYYMFDWVRQGEIEHCDGRDHQGDTNLKDGWANYKSNLLGHAVTHGGIATW